MINVLNCPKNFYYNFFVTIQASNCHQGTKSPSFTNPSELKTLVMQKFN